MHSAATRSPGCTSAPSGAERTTQRRLQLVLAAALEHLRERDASHLHVDDHAAVGSEHVLRSRLVDIDHLQARGAAQLDYLKRAHRRHPMDL
jgi:hypothetical protein